MIANNKTDELGRNDLQFEVYWTNFREDQAATLTTPARGDASGASSQSNLIHLHK